MLRLENSAREVSVAKDPRKRKVGASSEDVELAHPSTFFAAP